MTRDALWDCLKKWSGQKHQKRIEEGVKHANENDDGLWTKHTPWHWSRTHKGKRLDWWPTKKKFRYDGKIHCGNVIKFMEHNNEQ